MRVSLLVISAIGLTPPWFGVVCSTGLIDRFIVIPLEHRYGKSMKAVTVSPKFQIVIPKAVRDSVGIVSGQKIQMLTYRNRIELIPIKPMNKMRGFVQGIDTEVKRDKDRI